jgi:hypothetical protein
MGQTTCIVLVVIDGSGNLVPVLAARATPNTRVLFLMINEHATDDFKVEITDFKIKETMTPAQPLGAKSHFRTVKVGDFDMVKEKTGSNFGSNAGQLPFTTYKYTVNVTNLTAGTATVTHDPELDIPPP